MKYNNLTLALLSITLAAFSPCSIARQTLLDVYYDAVDSDPQIRSDYSLFQAEVENHEQSTGQLLPAIKLSGELARNREDVTTSGVGTSGLTYFDSNQLELKISQPLYRKDISTDIDASEAVSLAAEYEYKAAVQDLIMRVTRRYLAVLAARNDLDYLNTEKKAIQEQLNNARKRHNAGINTNADLFEAQATYDLAIAQVIVAESNLFDAKAALEEITSHTYPGLNDLKNKFIPVFDGPDNIEHWMSIAEENNPELIAARYRVASLQSEVSKSSSGHYPKLDLVARYANIESGGRFGDSETDDQSIALQLEIPIYEGGRVNAKVRESHNRLNSEKAQLTKTHRQIKREINKTFQSVHSTINRINALKQAVTSANSALSAIQSGYNAGSRTSSDILDARRELYKAKRDYLQEQYKYVVSYLELKQLAGNLSTADIEQVSSWFDQARQHH